MCRYRYVHNSQPCLPTDPVASDDKANAIVFAFAQMYAMRMKVLHTVGLFFEAVHAVVLVLRLIKPLLKTCTKWAGALFVQDGGGHLEHYQPRWNH